MLCSLFIINPKPKPCISRLSAIPKDQRPSTCLSGAGCLWWCHVQPCLWSMDVAKATLLREDGLDHINMIISLLPLISHHTRSSHFNRVPSSSQHYWWGSQMRCACCACILQSPLPLLPPRHLTNLVSIRNVFFLMNILLTLLHLCRRRHVLRPASSLVPPYWSRRLHLTPALHLYQ